VLIIRAAAPRAQRTKSGGEPRASISPARTAHDDLRAKPNPKNCGSIQGTGRTFYAASLTEGACRPSTHPTRLAAAAGLLLAAEGAANFGSRWTDIDVGDAAVGPFGSEETFGIAQVVGKDR
jgi:hypothetical protein